MSEVQMIKNNYIAQHQNYWKELKVQVIKNNYYLASEVRSNLIEPTNTISLPNIFLYFDLCD